MQESYQGPRHRRACRSHRWAVVVSTWPCHTRSRCCDGRKSRYTCGCSTISHNRWEPDMRRWTEPRCGDGICLFRMGLPRRALRRSGREERCRCGCSCRLFPVRQSNRRLFAGCWIRRADGIDHSLRRWGSGHGIHRYSRRRRRWAYSPWYMGVSAGRHQSRSRNCCEVRQANRAGRG